MLDAAGIDRISELLTGALEQAGVDRKDRLRLRLAIEDVLALWQSHMAVESECLFRSGTRFGRMYVEILAPGERMDPAEMDEGQSDAPLYSNLLAQAGLCPVYSYQDGNNCLALYPPKPQRLNSVVKLLASIGAAGLCGLLFTLLPQPARTVAAGLTDPLFDAMMGVLQCLAGPMIFLGVCWGVVSIGDVQALGKIARTVLARFLIAIFAVTGLTALGMIWLFHPAGEAAQMGTNAAAQIYGMILDVIPENLISPFLDGNSLKIIFMAVCMGLAILVLGDKTQAIRRLVGQANALIQFIMETVSRYVPVLVFVSLLSLALSGAAGNLYGIVKGISLAIAALIFWPLIYALAAALRLGVSFPVLLRKLLPTYLIALSTASSAAVLSTNLEVCQRQLGVSGRVANFAVPLGQVIFKTGAAIGFFMLALGLAEFYGVAVSPTWVVTGVLASGLLAIAAPPIPGGSLTCYTVLLTQLGIPAQAVGVAVAGNVILDFFMTACGISCLQSELTLAANKLGMLDREALCRE